MQPTSFTEAPSGIDLPEDLPLHCEHCHEQLDVEAWEFDLLEWGPKDIELIFTNPCEHCARVAKVVL